MSEQKGHYATFASPSSLTKEKTQECSIIPISSIKNYWITPKFPYKTQNIAQFCNTKKFTLPKNNI